MYLGLLTNDQHEHYVLSRVDEYVQTIKNDSLLLLDSFPQNPVKQFHAMRLNYQMVKAGTRFQQKVTLHTHCLNLHWKKSMQNY